MRRTVVVGSVLVLTAAAAGAALLLDAHVAPPSPFHGAASPEAAAEGAADAAAANGPARLASDRPREEERRRLLRERRLEAWADIERLFTEGRLDEARAALERLRASAPEFVADPERGDLAERLAGALAARLATARLSEMVGAGRLSEAARAALEGRLSATGQVLAAARSPEDLAALERHLKRFLLPDGALAGPDPTEGGDLLLRAFATDRRARRAKDEVLTTADVDEAERRRVDQLLNLLRRESVGLLDSIEIGLAWLALHQADDGSFVDKGVPARCKALGHASCLGGRVETGGRHAVAATALSVLAFLDFRDQDANGWFEPYLARGIAWLAKAQREDGSFGGTGQLYASAMALMALGQAAASTGSSDLRARVRRGVDWFAAAQGGAGGWRYAPGDALGDLSVTGWVAQALEAARAAGVQPTDGTRVRLDKFFDLVSLGEDRFTYRYPAGASRSLSPVGMLLGWLGWTRPTDATLAGWGTALAAWPAGSPPDLYTLYYGVRMSILLRRDLTSPWRDWVRNVAAGQALGETGRGTFAQSGWSKRGGVVVSNALSILTLEHALYLR